MSEEQPNPVVPPPVETPRQPEGSPDYSQPPQTPQYFQAYPPQSGYSAVDRIIPTKNIKALLAYYFSVFSIVPCFTVFLAPAAIVLGIMGLNECKRNPDLPGKAHAITGIVLGSITLFIALAAIVFIVLNAKRTPG